MIDFMVQNGKNKKKNSTGGYIRMEQSIIKTKRPPYGILAVLMIGAFIVNSHRLMAVCFYYCFN
jgi:hypothetical protein